MVLPMGNSVDGYPVLRVISTTGEATRTVRAPAGSYNGNVFPDGRHVAVTGLTSGDALHQLYVVSLDDGSQRMVAEIEGGGMGEHLAPSPDSRFVAYTTDGTYTSTIHEIDFGPAIDAILGR
jgi:Tol biopolymer transport system component